MHPLANILGTCILIFSSCAFITVYTKRIPPLPGGKPPESRRAVRKKQRNQAKNGRVKLDHLYICTRAFHFFPAFAQPPQTSISCPRPTSHHPCKLTSAYRPNPVPAFHLHAPSTPFYTYKILIHSHHVSKPSQYSLIHSARKIPFYFSSSFLSLSIRDTPTKLLKRVISRIFTFLLSALLIPHAVLRTTPLVQLLLHTDTSSHLPQMSHC